VSDPRKRLTLGQNATVNLGGKAVGMLLSLFVSAYVVHRLGLRAFGFWAVISAISQYAQLLDFGVGPSLTRFVAHLDERGDHADLQRQAASGLWGSVAFGTALTAVAAAIVVTLPHSVTKVWPSGWQVAAVCVAATLGLASIGSVFQAFPNGMGRWDLTNLAQVAGQATYSFLAVAAGRWSPVSSPTRRAGACGLIGSHRAPRR
jgi:O-antigen/teichoic acid export membrane protein